MIRRVALRLAAAAAMLAMQPAHAGADLIAAWQGAQRHDPVYAAARAQWQAGLTRDRQARALMRPEVAVTGSAGYVASDRDTRGAQFSAPGFGASNDASFRTRVDGGASAAWSVSALQPLYNVERRANARQLQHQAQLAEVRFQAASQELILRTAQAYFDVILAEETLRTLRAQKDEAARALDVAREKFEAGATPVTDRDEAQARYDGIRTREILAANEATVKRTAFTDLTGEAAAGLSRVGENPGPGFASPRTLEEWQQHAVQGSPAIAMQALGVDIARDETEKYRAALSPSVDLVARLADDRMRGPSGYGPTSHVTSSTQSLAVQVTVPLYTGGMRSAKRDEAAALADQARHEAQSVRQEVLRQTQAAWLAVTGGVERVRALQQALASSRSRLNATETGRDVGARTMLDFLDAQSDYYEAQRTLLQARYRLLLDRLLLAGIAGELGEATVLEINRLLTAP